MLSISHLKVKLNKPIIISKKSIIGIVIFLISLLNSSMPAFAYIPILISVEKLLACFL